ncbi:hypothetical protein G3570_03165 [Balneolaceae bacterium YR4-1]|uniref:Uncharacterized protein n=1 Tax=Halalkalibaculum roseum TaxID=2709311 RepID=A0A6M1SYH7_9BACT|nr:hypothetical protein [Halalkalibaculum roseum]NGP75617.1 hypothetical protein [Halalkalibaculum roseum]
MNLKDFCFPVAERQITVDDFHSEQVDLGNENTYLTSDYKSIIRKDTNKVFSIVHFSYMNERKEKLITEVLHFPGFNVKIFR